MARNRKRRGDRRPSEAAPAPPRVATARPVSERIGSRVDDTSDPLGHAAPDAELVEAELAAGEARAEQVEPGAVPAPPEPAAQSAIPGVTGDAPHVVQTDEEFDDEDGEAPEDLYPAARRTRHSNRLIGFAQGSWRELQRVQWPDQRQVVQATGVVLGFVIVAGAYLGLADWVAGKIVHFILS